MTFERCPFTERVYRLVGSAGGPPRRVEWAARCILSNDHRPADTHKIIGADSHLHEVTEERIR